VECAAQIAAYAQTLAADLLRNRSPEPIEPLYRVYGYNRFQACRFGFDAILVDPHARRHVTLRDDLIAALERLEPCAAELGTAIPLLSVAGSAARSLNDSRWLRERLEETKSLSDVVRLQAARWREEPAATALFRDSSARVDRAPT